MATIRFGTGETEDLLEGNLPGTAVALEVVDRSRSVSHASVIGLCFAVAMLEGYDIQAIGVAAPKMVPQLGLTPGQTGWAFSASMIGLVIGAIVGGWVADRIGRRPVLVASVATFGLFSLMTMVAGDYRSLVAVRIATGLGLGGALPNLIAIATEISRSDRRTTTITMMFCGMPMGGAVSALFARYAPPGLDWRLVFLIGGVLPLVLAPALRLYLPETRPDHAAAATERRALAALFGGGRALMTLLLWTTYALTLVVLYLLLNWLPTLVVAKGLPQASASLAALALNLGGVTGALCLGALVDRLGLRVPMAATYAALVAVMMGLAAATGFLAIVALSAMAGFLVVGAQYALYGVPPLYYAAAVRATGAGAAVAVGRLGSIAGPLVAGHLLGAGAAASAVVSSTVPVVLGAGAAAVLLTVLGRPYST